MERLAFPCPLGVWWQCIPLRRIPENSSVAMGGVELDLTWRPVCNRQGNTRVHLQGTSSMVCVGGFHGCSRHGSKHCLAPLKNLGVPWCIERTLTTTITSTINLAINVATTITMTTVITVAIAVSITVVTTITKTTITMTTVIAVDVAVAITVTVASATAFATVITIAATVRSASIALLMLLPFSVERCCATPPRQLDVLARVWSWNNDDVSKFHVHVSINLTRMGTPQHRNRTPPVRRKVVLSVRSSTCIHEEVLFLQLPA